MDTHPQEGGDLCREELWDIVLSGSRKSGFLVASLEALMETREAGAITEEQSVTIRRTPLVQIVGSVAAYVFAKDSMRATQLAELPEEVCGIPSEIFRRRAHQKALLGTAVSIFFGATPAVQKSMPEAFLEKLEIPVRVISMELTDYGIDIDGIDAPGATDFVARINDHLRARGGPATG